MLKPADYRVKVNKAKNSKVFESCHDSQKVMKHESDSDTNSRWRTRNSFQALGKESSSIGNQRKNKDHTHHTITEIGYNTEKSSEDLRRLAVTQTPLKDHQLKLV